MKFLKQIIRLLAVEIKDLEKDIEEFGDDLIVEVAVEEMGDFILYKEYNFISNNNDHEAMGFIINEREKMEMMMASDLLVLYEKQDQCLRFFVENAKSLKGYMDLEEFLPIIMPVLSPNTKNHIRKLVLGDYGIDECGGEFSLNDKGELSINIFNPQFMFHFIINND